MQLPTMEAQRHHVQHGCVVRLAVTTDDLVGEHPRIQTVGFKLVAQLVVVFFQA